MCVYSMIMDHRYDEWTRKYLPPSEPYGPTPNPFSPQTPTQEEIDEFRRLLERAREYDRIHNEPDCEVEEKKKLLRELAKKLGIEDKISFIN
jgi:hypothetical protein